MTTFTRALAAAGLLAAAVSDVRAAGVSFEIPAPVGAEYFGHRVEVLANGNIVLCDPRYDADGRTDVGAVSLHRPDGSLISRLTGSESQDRVGENGVVVLRDGDFVVASTLWHRRRGAATWVDAERGLDGVVSEENSLVGAPQAGNAQAEIGHVVALANGNYVVVSPAWAHAGAPRAGAVTWADGNGGSRGFVGVHNSLYGTQAADGVGEVVVLPNGHYVVASPAWRGQTGAVTWLDGTRPHAGPVSAENSLVGSVPGDQVGYFHHVLPNGDYLLNSLYWDAPDGTRDVGAVTLGRALGGLTGVVSAANSLVGRTADDGHLRSVRPLTNGNYLVLSRSSDEGSVVDAGSVTWCSGAMPCTGFPDPRTTLVGSSSNDLRISEIVALTQGNAVLAAPFWDESARATDVGAAVWLDGAAGRGGVIDGTSALIGTRPDDHVGRYVVPLPSGNYVVASSDWDRGDLVDAGAATWRSGAGGPGERVDDANSLTGKSPQAATGDQVYALGADDYVVSTPGWDDRDGLAFVGAFTYCPGAAACSGNGAIPSPAEDNSLVGTRSNDLLGAHVAWLGGADVLLLSPAWDYARAAGDLLIDAGAVTRWRGGTPGMRVGPENSMIGSRSLDRVGNNVGPIHVDRSLVVKSTAFGATAAGAHTYLSIDEPTRGGVDASNSVLGRGTLGLYMVTSYDASRRQLVVGDPRGNRVVLFRPGAATETTLSVAADLPITVGVPTTITVRVTSPTAAPTGAVRVHATTGESCAGERRPQPAGEAREAAYTCALNFASRGSREIRAEHFGDASFGYSSSAPSPVLVEGADALFLDGFEPGPRAAQRK